MAEERQLELLLEQQQHRIRRLHSRWCKQLEHSSWQLERCSNGCELACSNGYELVGSSFVLRPNHPS